MNDELLKQIADHLESLVYEVSRCADALDVLIDQNAGENHHTTKE
ncbi:hypothetical protein BH20PSE1_BH20PSE1_01500 [soil metagenome]